ncbi:MAG: flagellar biosynthesis protein FliQ [Candidatus Baltobacteraceae bacterium]
MGFGDAIGLGRDAILVCFMVAAPVLLVSMVVGLIISIVQATTQIQEPTLTFIPKIVASALTILFFGPFMLALLTDFMSRVFTHLKDFIR